MASATVTVQLQQPIGTIRPELHGQFIEHLGACIYDGTWVGPDSNIPDIGGLRRSTVEAL